MPDALLQLEQRFEPLIEGFHRLAAPGVHTPAFGTRQVFLPRPDARDSARGWRPHCTAWSWAGRCFAGFPDRESVGRSDGPPRRTPPFRQVIRAETPPIPAWPTPPPRN